MEADRKELALHWPSALVFPRDFSPSSERGEADKLEDEFIEAAVEPLADHRYSCRTHIYS